MKSFILVLLLGIFAIISVSCCDCSEGVNSIQQVEENPYHGRWIAMRFEIEPERDDVPAPGEFVFTIDDNALIQFGATILDTNGRIVNGSGRSPYSISEEIINDKVAYVDSIFDISIHFTSLDDFEGRIEVKEGPDRVHNIGLFIGDRVISKN